MVHSFDYIITNPPYGNGNIKAETGSLSTKRLEISFLVKIIHLLKVGGSACVIVPDGILEKSFLYCTKTRGFIPVRYSGYCPLSRNLLLLHIQKKRRMLFSSPSGMSILQRFNNRKYGPT